jgi:hypothetical protein
MIALAAGERKGRSGLADAPHVGEGGAQILLRDRLLVYAALGVHGPDTERAGGGRELVGQVVQVRVGRKVRHG